MSRRSAAVDALEEAIARLASGLGEPVGVKGKNGRTIIKYPTQRDVQMQLAAIQVLSQSLARIEKVRSGSAAMGFEVSDVGGDRIASDGSDDHGEDLEFEHDHDPGEARGRIIGFTL